MLKIREESGEIKDFDAVLFDMDGVLTDNLGFHRASWAACLREDYGLSIDADDPRLHAGLVREILPQVTGLRLSLEETEAFRERKEARYRDLARGALTPVPGLAAYLAWLADRGVRYGLVTGSDPVCIDFVLTELDLRTRFAVRVTGNDVDHGKPHPEAYLRAIAALGVAAASCLVHEDSAAGVASALAAGAQVAALATTLPEAALRPTGARWIVRDFQAWLGIVEAS